MTIDETILSILKLVSYSQLSVWLCVYIYTYIYSVHLVLAHSSIALTLETAMGILKLQVHVYTLF